MGKPAVDVKRILVVEDEPTIRKICQKVLAREGFDVDLSENGKVAQDAIESKKYDLCLIDMRMPVMDGRELYQWLGEKHPELIEGTIFTSGDVISAENKSFLEQGAKLFLPKPFTIDELKVVVKQASNRLGKKNGFQTA